VLVFLAVLGAVTGLGQVLALGGGWLRTPGPMFLFAWMAAAVLVYRSAILAGDIRRFDRSMPQVVVLQVLWVCAVSWDLPEGWALASAGVMGGFLVAWAFLDAQQLRGSTRVRNLYLVGFALVPPYLVALDAIGRRGLIARIESAPEHTLQWFFVFALMAVITTAILTVVGGHAREAAERQDSAERLLRERTALASERQSLQLVSRVLQGHVAAGRLRHDIANPLTVITATVDYLREATAGDDDLQDALVDVLAAADLMKALIATLPTPDDGPTVEETPIDDLMSEVEVSFRASVMGHGVEDASVQSLLEPSQVWAGPEHVLSLASLLVNGRMQQATPELRVHGTVLSEWFYRLEVRDFGVPRDQQRVAQARVRAGLRLQASVERAAYRGLGLGLPLCKLQLASHGAWIDVTTPEDGPGLVIEVILPRVSPELIPADQRTPELWVTSGTDSLSTFRGARV